MGEQWARFWLAMAVIFASCALIVVAATSPGWHVPLPAPGLVGWLEDHEKLSGWAQFVGAMVALFVTGWFARYEVRSAKRRESDRMKHLLLLTLMIVRGVRDVIQAQTEGGGVAVTAKIRKESLSILRPQLARAGDHLTSSFMLNNYSAITGHVAALMDDFGKIAGGTKFEIEYLGWRAEGLDAIANNLSNEVRRLGGRYESHDDLQLSSRLPMTIGARIKHWRRARAKKA